jgi:hypothetical protein
MIAWLALIPAFEREAQGRSYVHTAASLHRSHLHGEVPLGLRSSSPEVVTAWLAGKVPFEFSLPVSQSVPSDDLSYHIAGVSQVSYQGRGAALVIYQRRNETISLLVASSKSAVVAGGEEVPSGNLVFHYRSEDGLRVITWTIHGLSYALVSALSGSARESCMVCHQRRADVNQFHVAQ